MMVVADDNGAVRVAEDDLRAHVDEFVDEEESAFEHLLMEEHAASRLCGDRDEHREQVGGEPRPRCVGEGHNGSVEEGVHDIMRLTGHDEVVAVFLNLYAKSAEGIGDDAEVGE